MIRNSSQIVLAVFIIVLAILIAILIWFFGLELQGSQFGAQILFTVLAASIWLLQICMFLCEVTTEQDEQDNRSSKFSSKDKRNILGIFIFLSSLFLAFLPWWMTGRTYQSVVTLIASFIAFLQIIACLV